MRIVTPLTSIEELNILLNNGADEFYLGYIPYEWLDQYFNYLPLNGRERMYANFSFHSSKMMKELSQLGVSEKIYITFNAHYYNEQSYDVILDIIDFLYTLNFKKYIIADLNLIMFLKQRYDDIQIAVSGDMGLYNSQAIEYIAKYGVKRIIFPRKTPISEMKQIVHNTKKYDLEYEAFILNELCFYSGAFCNAFHCDELLRICRLPRRLVNLEGKIINIENLEKRTSNLSSNTDGDKYTLGGSGCGLCKIKELNDIGITHLKLVGRGKPISFLVKDLENIRTLLKKSNSTRTLLEFENYVIHKVFNGNCPKDCYYVDKQN